MRSAGLWPAYLSQILSTGLEIQSLMLRRFSDQEHGTVHHRVCTACQWHTHLEFLLCGAHLLLPWWQ